MKKMSLTLTAALLAACSLTVFSGCDSDPVAVTNVQLNKVTATLVVGDTEQLTADVLPADAENKAVAWNSNATTIASVSDNGLVTAMAAGAATITVTTADGGKTATCVVTVEAAEVLVESVTLEELDDEALTLEETATLQLTANVLPATATNKVLAWASDDEAVATVDANGLVTAVAEGEAVITATSTDGSNQSDACSVTVVAPAPAHPFGEISFRSDDVWEVGDQTWSDVVMATGCKKDAFDGGAEGAYKADCRQNPGYSDLFSWEAVNRHGDILCPDGWRVPAKDDFVALDIALGGTGEESMYDFTLLQKYVDEWGVEYGGYIWGGTLSKPESGTYWTSTPVVDDATRAYYLCVIIGGNGTMPQGKNLKEAGLSIRCVK